VFLFRFQGIKNLNKSENIVFCYWPAGFEQAMELQIRGRYFFDTDHNIIDDENLQAFRKKKQEKILLEAGKRSEYVISSARSMLQWYHNRGFENTYFMRNGISPERYNNLEAIKQNFKGPIIGYIGTISKWIDYKALEYLLKGNPSWNFLIYGKSYKNKISEDLERISNCHFMGSLKPEQVPATIKSFTAGINLYRKEPWLDVDSMKIYEYLAAGTPVVSIKYHDYLEEDFDGLLNLAEDKKEMNFILRQIVEGKIKKKDASSFLRESSWEQRVKKFYEEIITK
jgi:glycosyltransferase involved in cell wall biosynthesis